MNKKTIITALLALVSLGASAQLESVKELTMKLITSTMLQTIQRFTLTHWLGKAATALTRKRPTR